MRIQEVKSLVYLQPMLGENWQLVTDEPVELERQLVECQQDCRKITFHFRGIYRIYSTLRKENSQMWTCGRLDLVTLGYRLLLPKNLPELLTTTSLCNETWLAHIWIGIQELVSSYQISSSSCSHNIYFLKPAAFSSSPFITSTLSRSLGPHRAAHFKIHYFSKQRSVIWSP